MEPTKKHRLHCEKHRNQRKSTGFIIKNIGTNENVLIALIKNKHELTKKHWIYLEQNLEPTESTGFTVTKHRSQRESTGFE